MSKIKELRNNLEHNLNVIDMVSLIEPTKKTKYVEMFVNLMKKTKRLPDLNLEIKSELKKQFDISDEELNKIPDFHLAYYYTFYNNFFVFDDLKNFQKFCSYNERGLIEQNDLTKYESFNEVNDQLSLAQMKIDMKEMESQVKKLFENDEWVVLRPLTYASSCKYGSNTKWCTTSEYDYFVKYAGKGILLYMINKKTGLKVACYRELVNEAPEFSFWNQKDHRIDSMDSQLPDEILGVIKNEIKNSPIPNRSYLTLEQKNEEEKKYNGFGSKMRSMGEAEPAIAPPDEHVIDRDVLLRELTEREPMDEQPMEERSYDQYDQYVGMIGDLSRSIDEDYSTQAERLVNRITNGGYLNDEN